MTLRAVRRKQDASGFTLVELMIVVVITGVLAVIAIPSFSSYVKSSYTSEAVEFLGVIKLRQAATRAEFGAYIQRPSIDDSADIASDTVPDAIPQNGESVAFAPVPGDAFNQIGAQPAGFVRFSYGWAAGTPGVGSGVNGMANPPPDHWFVAQALGNLDGDSTNVTFEVTSHTRGVWISEAKGWD